ncbi:MAG: hypothetical protein IH608_10080 [Proteobacteria bacterium]|nr:hypothetical protein [Pseudomonadota bacterium]
MKTTRRLGVAVAVWATGAVPAWAAAAGGEGGVGVWTLLFLAFGALVIAFQAVPAVMLFGSLLRSLFVRRPVGAGAAAQGRKGT